jgi:hypothetical protein
MKKAFVILLISYSLIFFLLLIITLKGDPVGRARILMGLALFVAWVIVGGYLQRKLLARKHAWFATAQAHPILSFVLFSTLMSCVEEALATLMTNLAPLFGVSNGSAYITASTNYFHVIFLHSVIAFVPMFFVLGWVLKRYRVSPFQAFVIFGCVGILAEWTLAGPAVLVNAPFWVLVYGLMVYLPSHQFLHMERKRFLPILFPLLVPVIAFSAIATFWIPLLLDTGNHFN